MGSDRIGPVDEIQMLRSAAYDWRLSRGEVAVYAVLLMHADADGRTFPGPAVISKSATLAVTNVKIALRNLEALRYIEVHRPGPRKANRYQLLDSPRVTPRNAGVPSSEFKKGRFWERVRTQSGKPNSEATRNADVPTTRYESIPKLGTHTRQELAFNSQSNSSELGGEQKRHQEQEVNQRESVRAEYLSSKESNPKHARAMERMFPKHLADLIEEKAA